MLDSVYLCIIQIGLLNNHVKNKTSKKSIEQFSSVRRLRTLVHRLPQCEYQMQEKQLCLKVEMAASLECFWSLLLGVRPALWTLTVVRLTVLLRQIHPHQMSGAPVNKQPQSIIHMDYIQ